ncbi:lengsin [Erpetoichthys calabaricus]|uniref:lengsin n=1 Tax=Erpetoichthys calabaricus TaxID=27687 RepID=UPI0022341063|nr:lengsin [Erpetoichthys calabaricus]
MEEEDDICTKDSVNISKDEVDGSGISLKKRKGVKVSGKYLPPMEWEKGGSFRQIGQFDSSVAAMSRTPRSPSNYQQDGRLREESSDDQEKPGSPPSQCLQEDHWNTEQEATGVSVSEARVSRQTIQELKNLLRESSLLQTRTKPGMTGIYPCAQTPAKRSQEAPAVSFSTFKPFSEDPQSRMQVQKMATAAVQIRPGGDPCIVTGKPAGVNTKHSEMKQEVVLGAGGPGPRTDQADNTKDSAVDMSGIQNISTTDQIKQQIAREEISFVRFEATDLHGVSRSKTIPARFFQDKALYGVPMPRSYLELTLSPKDNEVDHMSATNFNSDILLVPDLGSFRILPWAVKTARVLCDAYTITGHPLRTSPRHVAKQMLSQLRAHGFSLHSSFTYECCIFGAPEKIDAKMVFFPAATLLSGQDLPFLQQLIDGMYYVGADVDSFSSASGPGQMEISLQPEFGIASADSAFTFRTGIKEVVRKHGYLASFFTNNGFHNAAVLSHSVWDVNGKRNLFQTGTGELSELSKKWLAGLLYHSAALSCLMAPGVSCRKHIAQEGKEAKNCVYATWGANDNNCAFNVKCHGGRGAQIDNKLGSATGNPYLALAATVAAGLDGIKRSLTLDTDSEGPISPSQLRHHAIPVKLEDALVALAEDHIIRGALGDAFVQYFIAMKRYEIETKELDAERNKGLEYFI